MNLVVMLKLYLKWNWNWHLNVELILIELYGMDLLKMLKKCKHFYWKAEL